MATKKPRRRRNKSSHKYVPSFGTVTLQPGDVPSDEALEAEAAALDKKTNGKYDTIKKDALDLPALQQMNMSELAKQAKKAGLDDVATLSKQKLVFEILKARAQKQGLMVGEGTLEIMPDGYGFLRSPEYSYMPSPDDVYVSPSQVRRFGLRKGQVIKGLIRPPKEAETYFCTTAS